MAAMKASLSNVSAQKNLAKVTFLAIWFQTWVEDTIRSGRLLRQATHRGIFGVEYSFIPMGPGNGAELGAHHDGDLERLVPVTRLKRGMS
jgi:hypothetical protein